MRYGTFLQTLAGVALGFVAGVVTVQIVAPDLFTARPAQTLPTAVTARMLATGDFRDVDSVRRATGRVQLARSDAFDVLRFTAFAVTEAPGLEVWLSSQPDVGGPRDVRAADVVSLGPLARQTGDQVYVLPAGLDPETIGSVLLWCPEFGTLYGVAPLEPAG